MAKESGNTKLKQANSINNVNAFIDKVVERNKLLYLTRGEYRKGIIEDINKGLSKQQLEEKWLYDDETTPVTSKGSHTFITKNGTFEIYVSQGKAYQGRLKGTTVTDKTKTFVINKDGKEIYSGYTEMDERTGRMKTPTSYKVAFKKMWE